MFRFALANGLENCMQYASLWLFFKCAACDCNFTRFWTFLGQWRPEILIITLFSMLFFRRIVHTWNVVKPSLHINNNYYALRSAKFALKCGANWILAKFTCACNVRSAWKLKHAMCGRATWKYVATHCLVISILGRGATSSARASRQAKTTITGLHAATVFYFAKSR